MPGDALDELVAAYRDWLVGDRGLAALTVLRYEKLARRFLRERAAVDASGLVQDLTAADAPRSCCRRARV